MRLRILLRRPVRILAALLFFVTIAAAQPGGSGEFVLGELRIGEPAGYINDFAGVLSSSQNRELEVICRRIDQETNAQITIVTIPTLAGESAAEVRTRLFETWKVGHKGDNRGLLILHAIAERRVEVEVGYDLEGVITDGRAGRILDQAVVPGLRTGNYYEGYRNGLAAFYERIRDDAGARPGAETYQGRRAAAPSREGKRKFPWQSLLMAPIFLFLLIKHPRLLLFIILSGMGGGRRGGSGSGGFGGGFGGFGGGMSGGGGAGRSY